MSTPVFKSIGTESLGALFKWFGDHGTRRIDSVHLHHTYMPNVSLFESLADSLGTDEAAGQELCKRMWRYHTVDKGWSEIAQHITVDPVGRIWLGRPFDRPPVSAKGHNGSYASGPLMIEMIGHFDRGAETMSDVQRNATLEVTAAIMNVYKLPPSTSLRFHSEMSTSSCPGTFLDKDAWVSDLEKRRKAKEDEPKKKSASVGTSLESDQTLLLGLLDSVGGKRSHTLDDSELLAEPPESDMSIDDIARMSRGAGLASRAIGRGGERGSSGASLNQVMVRQLKPYVVNLKQGSLSDEGKMITTPEDLDALVASLEVWVRKQLSDGDEATVPRVVFYAHGGINSEEDALIYAYEKYQWWLNQGVYPIFFVWETGIMETVMQLLEEYADTGGGERGVLDDLKSGISRVRDAAVEKFVNTVARDFWTIMKLSAIRASSIDENGGATQLARRIISLQVKLAGEITNGSGHAAGPIRFNAVGHSAGAIFHAHFVNTCVQKLKNGLRFDDVSLLAPACTIELFKEKIKDLLGNGKISKVNLFCLDRDTEANDHTVPFYGKSLLHLVSDGFEVKAGTPVLGMERYILADESMRQMLGFSGAGSGNARLILSPSGSDDDEEFRSDARTHGGFGRDFDTLRAVAMSLRGGVSADLVPSFSPRMNSTRGNDRLFMKLDSRLDSDVLRLVRGEVKDKPVTVAIETTEPGKINQTPYRVPAGSRTALCIGIDKYQEGITPLHGCVNDAKNWGKYLQEHGFDVKFLLDDDASLAGMKRAIGTIVSDAGDEDVVVIQYAGHGIQFEDLNSDEEDFMDEALVPVDCSDRYFLSDDELWVLLQGGRSDIHVFMDCCHSKSNTRAARPPGALARIVHPTADMMRNHKKRLKTDNVRSVSKSVELMKHVKFAAAGDTEYAYEHNGRGKFTTAALSAIRSVRSPISNHEFLLEIEKRFDGDTRQHPGLECPTGTKLMPFLSGIVMSAS